MLIFVSKLRSFQRIKDINLDKKLNCVSLDKSCHDKQKQQNEIRRNKNKWTVYIYAENMNTKSTLEIYGLQSFVDMESCTLNTVTIYAKDMSFNRWKQD